MTFLDALRRLFRSPPASDGEGAHELGSCVFRSDDPARPCPPGLLKRILGFEPDPDGLEYTIDWDLHGAGNHDETAVRFRPTPAQRQALSDRLHLRDLDAVRRDARWVSDFAWLVGRETGTDFNQQDCESFADLHKRDFQDEASGCDDIRFAYDSDVNSWWVAWEVRGRLNVLGFDRG